FRIECCREIVRMDVFHVESDEPGTLCRTVDLVAFNFTHARVSIVYQFLFIVQYCIRTHLCNLLARCRENDPRSDQRRTCFELHRQVRPCGLSQIDEIYHISTVFERLHFIKQSAFSIEYTDARWPQHLMPAECVEVDIQILDIH